MEITSYCYILTHIILILTCTQMFYLAKATTNLATDQSALLALKANIALDPRHILARNWTNSSSVCSWIGVTCSLRHHRVSALNISKMGLSATIPPFLANLSFLVSLDLSYNHFNGTVPNELSLLHRLKFISLRNNSFSGFIPTSLSNLSNLQFLQLSYNDLQGNIPEELGRLGRLQSLIIENNHLSGAIPSAIFNISTLKRIGFTTNELSGSLPSEMCSNLPLLEGLHLSDNQLSGQIPSYISQCSQLRILSLAYNSFSGQIPAEIGKLVWLQELYLGYNNLNGVLPREINNLHSLLTFSARMNQITGNLSRDIGNLTMIEYLDLSNNDLRGVVPKEIGNLTNIKILYLYDNNFTGVLPKEIGQLYLEYLELAANSFIGLIPSEIFNISTLLQLGLASNGLSGTLPTNLCYGLPILEEIILSGNYLSGAIPDSISNCSKLRRLGLAENNFTGFVPHFFGNLRLLEFVQLFSNNLRMESSSSELSFITSLTNCASLKSFGIGDNPDLHGVIPVSIGNLSSSLEEFYAYGCNIKGRIPANIGNLSNMVTLYLYNNELSGDIPHTVKHLHKLQGLSLRMNNLGGPIPKGLCDLPSLFVLGLGENQLSGPIPECLGNVSFLRYLLLYSNMLTSSIPSSLWHLKDLLELNLSKNSLSGILPPEIGNLLATTKIDLSRNQLSESIPATIGNLKTLIYLSFAHNRLEGIIPESVGSMLSLETLDFSYNNLSGSIPKSIENLQHLVNFNVSFNALSGEIPIGGPLKNFTMESFKANKALCGIQRFHVPLCPISNRRSRKNNVKVVLFILAVVIALTTIVSLTFIFIRYRRRDKTIRIDEQVSIVSERISYYEILQATEQFNESNLIDSGSFGSVYKGILRDGRVIAVKVFNMQNEAAFRSFDIECEVLRNIRHRNLTKVLSSCSNEDFRALILEYMTNGNLEKWLYSHNYCMDMMQRLNIMIDVASALEYLHHGYSTPIVHCDLKPSNVLLDEEMIGHVCDFGIARLLDNKESMVLTNTLATFGYIAPEYGLEGQVSRRCDVYSYGVMLMETFTRKKPSDDMFVGELSLKNWVQNSLPQLSHEIIDANLFINLDQQHSGKIVQCVSSILELALKCCAESPSDRINMKEALTQLLKIKSQCSQVVLNY